MFLDYKQVNHLFIVCGKTDLRKGIDGLASIVQHEYQLDVYDNALFLFCGGRQDRFKMLYYDKDGFLLLYKRLDQGKLRWPRTKKEVRCLTHQQIRWLLEGLSIDQPQAIRAGKQGVF
ncbi:MULTISPECIES: IS66 family insertion sequence element accessory protein TnpB [Enterococcus]|jgi:transposase|uniref:IS66 family insertion sequence element accessory protein TnpB n=2 Tax=Enterococcus TaxID=1350 RepID=UPI0014324B78|nr:MULTISPECIES: IS66 family insertion sequence element accessory protein TnpB [Enterococcus]MBE8849487.1 IS66 family insertion sequence element accessory protein TnpB [Enterococcus durans]MCM6932484.1 IS66 family insertion sequence element accessory protein TnpB [Enterococcus italicus]QIT57978.1 IS66 family insertion sequence element accessory protein TnpB [Enterococcus faecium]QIT60362.1 IS66 family insertion sequence element accessory protein TnpB [Enterococcus faecium]